MRRRAADPPGTPACFVMVPHAGYTYSGSVAGATLRRVQVPGRVVLLGPNHTGEGERRSLWRSGSWRIPTGEVLVDEALAERLESSCGCVPDRLAHLREHSLEVMLPFLQALRPDVRVVPLQLAHLGLEACLALGRDLARVLGEFPLLDPSGRRDVMLLASSDMSHFIPAPEARERDGAALERVAALDPEGLYRIVHHQNISMCGVVPVTVALAAARELGAGPCEVIAYGTSGDVTGDDSSVVGYAGARAAWRSVS